MSPSSIHPIDAKDLTNPDQFQFLSRLLKDVEVVSLSESIHMTHEFPLVRLGIVRYLHENLGFHVLVMEGSAPDVWVAQDQLLNSPRGTQDCERALGGFFGLWNTQEMSKVVEYEAASWNSSHPLYIAGYDVQAGNGYRSHGDAVFNQLADRLLNYASPPKGFDRGQWLRSIQPLVTNYRREDRTSVESAIQALEQWIRKAKPKVQKRFPAIPHATALSSIPDNLRTALEFRDGVAASGPQAYQGLRDTSAARYVVRVKQAVAGQKLMLWAHVSHLHNDNRSGPPSVGGILHQILGPRLYTITPFAESGGAMLIFAGNKNENVGYGEVHARGDLAQLLSSLSDRDYFLDLRSLPAGASSDTLFRTPQPVPRESGQITSVLADDQDGIIWIKTVHAPDRTLWQAQ